MTHTHLPGLSLALVLPLAMPVLPASALTFDWLDGQVQGKFDTSLSAGASFSTENPAPSLYTYADGQQAGQRAGSGVSPNADNGRLNFKRGDLISNTYKGLSELELATEQMGLRVSGKYWYDHQLESGSARFRDFDDDGFAPLARFKGFSWLDSYLFASGQWRDHPLDLRFGRQVLSWGESTFIQGGINSISPLDQSAFNRPGVEIKEGLLPVEMLQGSVGLADGLSLEGFYQYNWRPAVLDGCGTFFAITDAIQPGCGPIVTFPGLGEAEQIAGTGQPIPPGGNAAVERLADNLPRDSGQFGFALRYYADWLSGTEFGLYALNYHSRFVYLSGESADFSQLALGRPTDLARFYTGRMIAGQPLFINGASYFADYPEDIRLYGVSFNSSFASGLALSGELSHRPNLPVQINVNDILPALLLQSSNPATELLLPGGLGNSANYNQQVSGYRRLPVTQAQLTFTQFFSHVLGAEQLKAVAEVGYVHVADLDALRYGRSAALGAGEQLAGVPCYSGSRLSNRYCTDEGFTTRHSWGYRVLGQLDYSDWLAGAVVSPSLAFRHDVDGYAYQPAGPFEEGQMATTLAMQLVYQERYKASVSWTSFFGDNDYSTVDDRDYLALSIALSF